MPKIPLLYNKILFALLVFVALYDAIYPIFPGLFFQSLQGFALVWLLISVPIYFSMKRKPLFISSLLCFLIVISYSYYVSGASGFNFFKMTFLSTLAIFPFYICDIPEYTFKKFSVILMVAGVFVFFRLLAVIRMENENGYGGGYIILTLLPLGLYLFRDKKMYIQAIWALIIFILVLYSVKRGDVLACTVAIFAYFLTKIIQGKRVKFKSIIILIALVTIGYYVALRMIETSEVLQARLIQTENGDSSGRDEGYALLFSYYLDSPLLNQIFGYGFDKTTTLSAWGLRAHNDWLEILLGEGLIGVFLYLLMVLSLFRYSLHKYVPEECRPILITIFAIWLVKSMVSMFIFSTPTFILFILIGYILKKSRV